MKHILSTFLLFLVGVLLVQANETSYVQQVQSDVTLSADVDYVVRSQNPFANTSLKVDITNTDHAVLIFEAVKPSDVIKNYLLQVCIKGAKAVDGTNCRVKPYAAGTIILPYTASQSPLVCYSEANFGGTVFSGYSLGNTGGYMNTLSSAQGNNNIRSFRLKRGFMVTFATGTSGWGYSRCFIADNKDLEVPVMPAVLNGKVSSYRLFEWFDVQKKGISGDSGAEVTRATNAGWSFTWGLGASQAPDVEFVPHKIKKSWPSAVEMGKVGFSPHAKTDNEPANSADEEPCSVTDVLAYWQDMMRTGMRLCSPSSHDGGYAWLEEFMREIDARGWRCDVLDMHCYWASGSFSSLKDYYNKYHRPIWISELMWGASWNHNGIFSAVSNAGDNSASNQQALYNGAKPIVDALNGYDFVERYAWWNSENVASKIYYNGKLTTFGQYYANMNSGMAYRKSREFVPVVVMKNPYNLSVDVKGNSVTLKWNDDNGDMMDEIQVQCRKPGSSKWTCLSTVSRKDKTGTGSQSYTYTCTLDDASQCSLRIVDVLEGKQYASNQTWPAQTEGFITSVPANLEDFYFMFYSKEAAEELVWAVSGNDVVYRHPSSTPGGDPAQLFALEENAVNGGLSLRNQSTPSFLICTPNSWNFNTNNADYRIPSAKTAFLPVFTDDYCVVRNVAHNTYVGLWDNDKKFGDGERLAGNRLNYSGNDSGDKVRLYVIPRSKAEDLMSGKVEEEGEVSLDFASLSEPVVSDVDPYTWGGGATEPLYIYNVEADAFMTYGMNWNTNGIATRLNNGDSSSSPRHNCFVSCEDDRVNIVCGAFMDRFVGTDGNVNSVWMDFSSDKDWYLTDCGNGTYQLANGSPSGNKLDVSYAYGGHLTTVNGKGYTRWAFLTTSDVASGRYAAYKVRRRLYDLLSALQPEVDELPLICQQAIGRALAAYSNPLSTAQSLLDAQREVVLAAGSWLPSGTDVSCVFNQADIMGQRGLSAWTTTDMPLSYSEYEKYHAPFRLDQQQTGLPVGYYTVTFHSLLRRDNADLAPYLKVTGNETHQAQLPVMNDLDWGSNVANDNGWRNAGGRIVPDNMLSCGQALTHDGAVAVVQDVLATKGTLRITLDLTGNSQWFNMQGFDIQYRALPEHDVNLDGKVDREDVKALEQILLHTPASAAFDLHKADLNHDGKVTLSDLPLLINLLTDK